MARKRIDDKPLRITIIAWILLFSGLMAFLYGTASLFSSALQRELETHSRLPLPLQQIMMFISVLISVVSGIGILKKCNWARWIYVVWCMAGFLISLFLGAVEPNMIQGLLFAILIVAFLFSPVANQYFSKKRTSGSQ